MPLSKKFKIFFLITLIFSCSSVFAQYRTPSKDSFWDHVRFGGGVSLSLSGDYFSGSIAPSAIYDFNSYFSTGVGLDFSYFNTDYDESFVYGGSLIGLFRPIPEIQISLEFQELHVNHNYSLNNSRDTSYWYPSLFLGIGYSTGPVTFGIRYDLLYNDSESIYANAYMPFVRVYF